MSRRKQSNPKPLKLDEECWNEAEDGENKPGSKSKPAATATAGEVSKCPEKPPDPVNEPDDGEQSDSTLNPDEDPDGQDQDSGRGGENGDENPNKVKNSVKRRKSQNFDGEEDTGGIECTTSNNNDVKSRNPAEILDMNGFSHEQLLAAAAGRLPYLHLLGNDAARLFLSSMPQMLPPVSPNGGNEGSVKSSDGKSINSENGPIRNGPPAFFCEPCNIKFSSARTLEAHSTFYCSFRKDSNNPTNSGKDGDLSTQDKSLDIDDGDSNSKTDLSGTLCGKRSRRESSSGQQQALQSEHCEDSQGELGAEGGSVKSLKTGKLYTCAYCSYSADKKVSLNRHMRMHSGGPSNSSNNNSNHSMDDHGEGSGGGNPGSGGGNPGSSGGNSGSAGKNFNAAALERYCKDCDIQFLNIKTFRVHKQYYCSTRHVLKAQQQQFASAVGEKITTSPPESPVICPQNSSPHLSSSGPTPDDQSTQNQQQPYLVLPTNPVIILPYSIINGASLLPPGPNSLPTHNALLVSPIGSVQILPSTHMGSISPSYARPSSTTSSISPTVSQSQQNNGKNNGIFNDPKEIMKKMDDPTGKNPRNSPKLVKIEPVESADEHEHDEEMLRDGNSPAIDLTFNRNKVEKNVKIEDVDDGDKEIDEEKENFHRRNSYDLGGNRDILIPSPSSASCTENLIQKRSSRPSSNSMSSVCSTPPSTNDPGMPKDCKINGLVVPGQQSQGQSHSRGHSKSHSRSSGDAGGKLSPISTQLPGGAILTSATSNQSLAELLMSNPPELNESLAKLNPQLFSAMTSMSMSSRSQQAAAAALMSSFSPEIAMRFLDPYWNNLQQLIQQQQQQQQQQNSSPSPAPSAAGSGPPTAGNTPPVKRGVSKCIECDIVFYKYENYLVHKEHYCAARTNAQSSPGPPALPSRSSSQSGDKSRKSKENSSITTVLPLLSSHSSRSSSSSSPDKIQSELTLGLIETQNSNEGQNGPPRKISNSHRRQSPENLTISYENSSNLSKNRMKSPLIVIPSPGSGSGKNSNSSAASRQHPCVKCGVKFSSIDNLSTHQTYYCTKRDGVDLPPPPIVISPAPPQSPSPGGGNKMNNSVDKSQMGFIKCGKCKIPIAEDQIIQHKNSCGGNLSNSNSSGGSGSGWKCPCCDTFSPTVSAAQKHLEKHTGIRAFKCVLCGYRGNTLRGMRTHIRMHFDKRVSDLQESEYIACITSPDSEVTLPQISPVQLPLPTPPPQILPPTNSDHNSNHLSSGRSSRDSNSNSNLKGNGGRNSQSPQINHQVHLNNNENSSDCELHSNTSPGDLDQNSSNSNSRLHFCNLCNYSSSYKGNVVRHMKLVHKISEEHADELLLLCGNNLNENSNHSMTLMEKVNGDLCSNSSPEHTEEIENDNDNDDNDLVVGNPDGKLVKGAGQGQGRYCKYCNIYFNHIETYIAHKKLYCTAVSESKNNSHSSDLLLEEQKQQNSARNSSKRAQTPVQ